MNARRRTDFENELNRNSRYQPNPQLSLRQKTNQALMATSPAQRTSSQAQRLIDDVKRSQTERRKARSGSRSSSSSRGF